MDLSDLSYPMVANTDYSPIQEAYPYANMFDKAHFQDTYTTSPDHTLTPFLDSDSFFDQPVTSVEFPRSLVPKNRAVFNPPSATTNTSTVYPPAFISAPFDPPENFASTFSFSPTISDSFKPNYPSPQLPTDASPTPSLYDDASQHLHPSPRALSPHTLARESPSSPISTTKEAAQKRPQRKRGRPRLDCTASATPSMSPRSPKCQRMSRLPHNQVERKYREGLNTELERLRRAVPTLPQNDDGGSVAQPKPSKAMVLAGAIDYIRKMERERDLLLHENERLRAREASRNSK